MQPKIFLPQMPFENDEFSISQRWAYGFVPCNLTPRKGHFLGNHLARLPLGWQTWYHAAGGSTLGIDGLQMARGPQKSMGLGKGGLRLRYGHFFGIYVNFRGCNHFFFLAKCLFAFDALTA